jgi:hypothetical protein
MREGLDCQIVISALFANSKFEHTYSKTDNTESTKVLGSIDCL